MRGSIGLSPVYGTAIATRATPNSPFRRQPKPALGLDPRGARLDKARRREAGQSPPARGWTKPDLQAVTGQRPGTRSASGTSREQQGHEGYARVAMVMLR